MRSVDACSRHSICCWSDLRHTMEKVLKYTIHKCSSFSGSYAPGNIMENKPIDQSSRWSSDSNSPPQFLVLKLEKPAIVKSILFGKFEKTHVCNLKKFKVLGGLSDEHMIELLEKGLRNDSSPESFRLKHVISGHVFPCRFIKIVPLQSWGPSFNYSIWYVELHGIDDWDVVKPSMNWYNTYREDEAVRLCLKHFRQQNYMDVFHALRKHTKARVQFEDPLLSELHKLLVVDGDFDRCEQLLAELLEKGIFSSYLSRQEYQPVWERLTPPLKEMNSSMRPGMRGGHQMCIDVKSETIYLFAGWDGIQDLSDFWAYSIPDKSWICLSRDTEADGGPSPRSCHKVCLDPERKQIFTLGRYIDANTQGPKSFQSDFYMYDIESRKWVLIMDDTLSMGGPPLIFDHQMCMDVEGRCIYVFGGRVVQSPESGNEATTEALYSGLYAYHVSTNTWRKIRDEVSPERMSIRPRSGHSMLFHPTKRELYIFAGQRSKEYFKDFYIYKVDTDGLEEVEEAEVPLTGVTQRATLDPELNEIHMLSGLSKEKDKRWNGVRNSLWVFDLSENRWSCVYKNDASNQALSDKIQKEPCPRYAHQLVYDEVHKIHYLFGGNPGRPCLPKLRLDDFWSLHLSRLSKEQLLRKCRFLIRKQRFHELASENTVSALMYLQTSLAEVIDHSVNENITEFHQLAASLFPSTPESDDIGQQPTIFQEEVNTPAHFRSRTALYDSLVLLFPEEMTQPKGNLVDLISMLESEDGDAESELLYIPSTPRIRTRRHRVHTYAHPSGVGSTTGRGKRGRRYDNAMYLINLIDDDFEELDIHHFIEGSASGFALLFQKHDLMEAWNHFVDLGEEEQMEMLGMQKKRKSSDGESHHERRNVRKSSSEDKTANHPGYMGGEAEAYLRINQSLRTLFHRRHLPLGILAELEEEVVDFFGESPMDVYVSRALSPLQRSFLHAICQFHCLCANSLESGDSPVRMMQVDNPYLNFPCNCCRLLNYVETKVRAK
ncbi:unnamed protein product [Darwinula stevensoni]|uniref:Muskelin n=1 Tax=Darwinula stevensoni TaxID=69355 RepID=A0A7R8XE74_9CRUS|nr:unnamed protein product [Darwinula stevensoni]CAG0889290.1 unnamed protein product [Darwinula stevensoni]